MSTARKILYTTLVTGALGCGNPRTSQQPYKINPADFVADTTHHALEPLKKLSVADETGTVSHYAFVDSSGHLFNPETVRKQLIGHNTSVSFQFAACPSICITIRKALQKLSIQDSTMRHLVIATDPENDFFGYPSDHPTEGTSLKERLAQYGLFTSGPHMNTIVLYPIGPGKELHEQLKNGRATTVTAAQDSYKTLYSETDHHTPSVMLDDAHGKNITQATGIGNDIDEEAESLFNQLSPKLQETIDAQKARSGRSH